MTLSIILSLAKLINCVEIASYDTLSGASVPRRGEKRVTIFFCRANFVLLEKFLRRFVALTSAIPTVFGSGSLLPSYSL